MDKHGDTLHFLLRVKPEALVSEAVLPQNPQRLNSTRPSVTNADQHKAYRSGFCCKNEG